MRPVCFDHNPLTRSKNILTHMKQKYIGELKRAVFLLYVKQKQIGELMESCTIIEEHLK